MRAWQGLFQRIDQRGQLRLWQRYLHQHAARTPLHLPWPGLWLAGDYTGGHDGEGYPGTLETAVRSGQAVAAALLRGRPGPPSGRPRPA